MGSVVDEKDEFTVLVTGFGPFRDEYPRNPSSEIALSLPSYLPPRQAKDPLARQAPAIPAVRILVHPEPVRVSYKVVRELVPQLHESGRRHDVVIHIGMSGPKPQYQIERRGHRDGYKSRDVDEELLEDQDAEGSHKEGWYWEGLPSDLETELDLDDILTRWKGHSPSDANLSISNDAGHYLCDFIYYSSMSYLYGKSRPRKVVFLHVPAEANDETIPRGRDITLSLIRSIVESELRERDGAKEGGEAEAEVATDGK